MKRFFSLLLCIILLMSMSSAFAADKDALQVIGYQLTDSSLDVQLYAKVDKAATKDNFNIKIDNVEIPVEKLSAYSAGYGTSWIAVIEPAPGSPVIRQTVSALISSVMASFGKEDTMAIYDAGTGDQSAFMSTEAAVMPYVEAALNGANKIKLYDAVEAALDTFSGTSMDEHKCLLVISRMVDEESNSRFNDVRREAADLPITIYSVGLTEDSDSLKKAFQEFSALSSVTPSGLAVSIKKIDAENAAPVAKQITDNEKSNFYVLSAPFTASMLSVSDGPAPLNITYQLKNEKLEAELEGFDGTALQEKLQAASITSHEHEWKDATCTEPKTCTVCGETEGKPLGHDYSKASFFKRGVCARCGDEIPSKLDGIISWAKGNPILAGMAAILFIGIVVLIIVLLSKRKKPEPDPEPNPDPDNGTTKPLPKVTITLTNAKTGEQFTGDIHNVSIKAGRSAALSLKGDPSISGTHMEFVWQNGCLYVQDANSTNGTLLNGKEVHGAVALNQNDMLHVGTSDFRVNWHSNR